MQPSVRILMKDRLVITDCSAPIPLYNEQKPPPPTTTETTTAPISTRTFPFIEIDEDVPLAVKTTPPLDLELILIEESIPLSTLPYTGMATNEWYIGIGLLIVAIGVMVGKNI